MAEHFLHIDAFTDQPFGGNPAGVFLLDREHETEWMQALARETRLPATAFVQARDHAFGLRWFTERDELVLCGHGTLASAHALWAAGGVPRDRTIHFETRGGRLSARWNDGWVHLDFPAEPATPVEPPATLLEALGMRPARVLRNRLDYLVELESEQAVRTIAPDFEKLLAVETRGVIVTAASASAEADFVSRFFCPSVGVNEDPVTGSAHCALGPFWAERLGKDTLQARQLSERGGTLRVAVQGDRVDLAGQAVTVYQGTHAA
jgi:PhzF family phenazine biosynthesis protein